METIGGSRAPKATSSTFRRPRSCKPWARNRIGPTVTPPVMAGGGEHAGACCGVRMRALPDAGRSCPSRHEGRFRRSRIGTQHRHGLSTPHLWPDA